MTEKNSLNLKCLVCGKPTKLACKFCQKVFYCTQEHLNTDWENHKTECTKFNFMADIKDDDIEDLELLYKLKEWCSQRSVIRSKMMVDFAKDDNMDSLEGIKAIFGTLLQTCILGINLYTIFFAKFKFLTYKR